jgi:hypothetical protein
MLPGKISFAEQTKMYYVYTLSYPEEMGGTVFFILAKEQESVW